MVKNPPANARELVLVPGWRRFPGEGNGKPLQHLPCENPWTEEHGRLQFRESQKSQFTESKLSD